MIKELLNLNATDTAEVMFGITTERLEEMNEGLFIAENEIAINHKDYTAPGTEDCPGDGLHVGKALERILQIAKTPQEELAILYAFPTFIDRSIDAINRALLKGKIQGKHPDAKIITIEL